MVDTIKRESVSVEDRKSICFPSTARVPLLFYIASMSVSMDSFSSRGYIAPNNRIKSLLFVVLFGFICSTFTVVVRYFNRQDGWKWTECCGVLAMVLSYRSPLLVSLI
jgi:cytochrome c oxidase subunit IV